MLRIFWGFTWVCPHGFCSLQSPPNFSFQDLVSVLSSWPWDTYLETFLLFDVVCLCLSACGHPPTPQSQWLYNDEHFFLAHITRGWLSRVVPAPQLLIPRAQAIGAAPSKTTHS